jgi:hypothetical protein
VASVASTFHNDAHSIRTENLGKDFPSLPAKPAASIQASLSDYQTTLQDGATEAVRRVRRTREA